MANVTIDPYYSVAGTSSRLLETTLNTDTGELTRSHELENMSLDDLNFLFMQYSSQNKDGRLNDMLQAIQNVIQQKYARENADRDYQRSLPANQVAQLRAAGMSRSGALSLLQNGGESSTDSSLSPFQNVNTDLERKRGIMDMISSGVSALTSIVSLPASIGAKMATSLLASTQGKMLQDQQSGLQMVAHFEQASANAIASGKLDKNASLSDKLEYFRAAGSLQPTNPNYDFGSFAYATGGLFQQSLNNPFFYSFARSFEEQANSADASVFEPERMQEIVQSMQASKQLTRDQNKFLNTEFSILQRRDRREALVQQLQEDLDQVSLSTELTKADFDNERWERIIDNIDKWSFLDSLQVEAEIKNLSLISDPIVYARKLENLRNNEKVVASTIMHAQYIADLTNAGDEEIQNDPDAHEKAINAAQDATIYRELYGGRLFDQILRGVSGAAQFVGAVGSVIGAFKGTSLLPSVGMSTLRTFGNNETETHSVVESVGESTVQFHRYPHRLQN